MTDNFDREPVARKPELVFDSRLEELQHAMRCRIAYYVDESTSYERADVSLLMDVLDPRKITIYDLSNEELAELTELEKDLKREHLRNDLIIEDDERGEK